MKDKILNFLLNLFKKLKILENTLNINKIELKPPLKYFDYI